ncbi:MAG: bifunctional oligoribonuclease/PAP phosphatase NrnA [Halobacteriaceae archaeon]
MVAGVPTDLGTGALLAGGTLAVGAAGGYAVRSLLSRRQAGEQTDAEALRQTLAKHDKLLVLVPADPSIDALAAAVGCAAICAEWGLPTTIAARGPLTTEDTKAFCNIFDLNLQILDEEEIDEVAVETDGVVMIGGGGSVPEQIGHIPVIAVLRHRPVAENGSIAISPSNAGATSTVVTNLLRESDIVPEQRAATALLYGIRAGTRKFRRVGGQIDYDAASYLHDQANQKQIDDLRAPGMSSDTFDVLGEAIENRGREASFCVTNAGDVPAVSTLEEAAETILRLDGVSCTAVFGVHEDMVVVNCRTEDVRTSALDLLSEAFDHTESIGGSADSATARIPLGLFGDVDDDHADTRDELIDASTRRALFAAFEGS